MGHLTRNESCALLILGPFLETCILWPSRPTLVRVFIERCTLLLSFPFTHPLISLIRISPSTHPRLFSASTKPTPNFLRRFPTNPNHNPRFPRSLNQHQIFDPTYILSLLLTSTASKFCGVNTLTLKRLIIDYEIVCWCHSKKETVYWWFISIWVLQPTYCWAGFFPMQFSI